MQRINSSLKWIRSDHAELMDTLKQAEERTGLNAIVKRTGEGPMRLSDEPQPDEIKRSAAPPASASVSVNTSSYKEAPAPPKPRKRIDVAALMRETEAEMEQ